jgi:hypothetical protein
VPSLAGDRRIVDRGRQPKHEVHPRGDTRDRKQGRGRGRLLARREVALIVDGLVAAQAERR